MDAIVSSSGNLTNDGKGHYYTGKDWIGIWLNPLRWSQQSFHLCMNWPFGSVKECDSAGSLSPQSAEVRFCNSDCSEYNNVIFGDHSLFGNVNIHGAGSTRPIVTRTSELTWTISFPAGTVGRLWDRTPEVPTTELYHYEGSIDIKKQ